MFWYHDECMNVKKEGAWHCPTCCAMPKNVMSLLTKISDLQSQLQALHQADIENGLSLAEIKEDCQIIKRDNAELKDQVKGLQRHLLFPLEHDSEAAEDKSDELSPASSNSNDWSEVRKKKRKSFTEVIRTTVETALQDHKAPNDVIISKAEEKGQDTKFVANLCAKAKLTTKPTEIQRLGQKTNDSNHHRLLRIAFPTSFDARTFKAEVERLVKEETGVPKLRVRSGKTKEERKKFAANAKTTHKLNVEAKSAGSSVSFSLRDNGDVWKFVKSKEGQWKRDHEWKLENSGNINA